MANDNPVIQSDILLLPGEPEFDQTMILGWKILNAQKSLDSLIFGSDGVARSVDEKGLQDYLFGGEYDERESWVSDSQGDDDVVWLDEFEDEK